MNLPGWFPPNQMAVTSLLDSSLPETIISEEKSQQIVDLIKERFNETDHAPVSKQKETFLEGDRSDDSHMLSRNMMQKYIGSYWYHFSEQVPICKLKVYVFGFTANMYSAQTHLLARQHTESSLDCNDGYWSFMLGQDARLQSYSAWC
jgi:hypothetical protein